MKPILLFILLAPLVLSFSLETSSNILFATSTSCNATDSCASIGDACTGDFLDPSRCSLSNETCCAMGLYCISNTCQPEQFGSCSTIDDCYPPFTTHNDYDCINGNCEFYYRAGDYCSESSPCDYGLTCVNSACQGLSLGSNCSSSLGQCAFGLYCKPDTSVCTNTIAPGGVCSSISDKCYPGYTCIDDKCQKMYSVGSGGSCVIPKDCQIGLTCVNGNCVSVNTSLQSCTKNANCYDGGVCTCSPVTGNQFCVGDPLLDPCTAEDSDLMFCLVNNNCTYNTDAPDSCCFSHCSYEYKKSFNCECSINDLLLGSCVFNQYC